MDNMSRVMEVLWRSDRPLRVREIQSEIPYLRESQIRRALITLKEHHNFILIIRKVEGQAGYKKLAHVKAYYKINDSTHDKKGKPIKGKIALIKDYLEKKRNETPQDQ